MGAAEQGNGGDAVGPAVTSPSSSSAATASANAAQMAALNYAISHNNLAQANQILANNPSLGPEYSNAGGISSGLTSQQQSVINAEGAAQQASTPATAAYIAPPAPKATTTTSSTSSPQSQGYSALTSPPTDTSGITTGISNSPYGPLQSGYEQQAAAAQQQANIQSQFLGS